MSVYPSDIGQFVIGLSPIGGAGAPPWPPPGPTTLQKTINAYLYVEYNDDETLQAFFAAYNEFTQTYVDYFNAYSLSIYSAGNISGPLLDLVALGLYGRIRPGLPIPGSPEIGPYNTYGYNFPLPYNGAIPAVGQGYYQTTDDIFRRILTWALYKGDGRQFSITWLKRRILRFLYGLNGTDPTCVSNAPQIYIDNTYSISVLPTGPYQYTITLTSTPISIIFKTAVDAGILELPFQIAWTVTLI